MLLLASVAAVVTAGPILSGDVDFEAAQAEARNGVLKVRLPKREAAKPRTIPVQT